MTMAHRGLAKLSEELGELQQVVGKMLAYGAGDHPDKGPKLLTRFEEEAADVIAAISFIGDEWGTDNDHIRNRAKLKLDKLNKWHADPNV